MDWSLSSYDNLKIKIFDENTQQYVALLEGFIMDRIRDARNLNDNLKENLENNLYSSFATEGID